MRNPIHRTLVFTFDHSILSQDTFFTCYVYCLMTHTQNCGQFIFSCIFSDKVIAWFVSIQALVSKLYLLTSLTSKNTLLACYQSYFCLHLSFSIRVTQEIFVKTNNYCIFSKQYFSSCFEIHDASGT